MYGIDNEMMKRVYETGLALDDIALYLDTHPNDRAAMNYYQMIKRENDAAIRDYESSYGPLMYNRVATDNWSWIDNPWPWEGGCN